MRRTATLTALLIGAALLAPTGAATAAGETCRGEAATIVGTGPTAQGTDGRDVIVTGTAFNVASGAGDDLVCVTGIGSQGNIVNVDAGPGNDVVDSSAMPAMFYLTALLGDGADTFVGGSGNDRVVAGAAPSFYVEPPTEAEQDLIDTGDGSDSVISGGPGLTNDDVVRTGSGGDAVTWSGTMGADSALDGGADDGDTLIVRASGHSFRIDLTAHTLTRNGLPEASFTSFEYFYVAPEPDLGSVEVLGTDGADDVKVRDGAKLVADLGDGDDRLSLGKLKMGGQIDLGAGTDTVFTRSVDGSIEADLTNDSVVVDGSASSFSGVENVYASARNVKLIGDDEPNSLGATGCFATVNGRGADDTIGHGNYDGDADFGYSCEDSTTKLSGGSGQDTIRGGVRADRIYGGGGDDRINTGAAREGRNKVWGGGGDDKIRGGGDKDVLAGGAGKDTIRGSKGRDVAIGGPHRDACSAEVERSCER